MDKLWHPGVDNLLFCLSSNFYNTNYFPSTLKNSFRINSSQPLLFELRRLVDENNLDLSSVLITPYLLAMGYINWESQNQIKNFSIQLLLNPNNPIEDCYVESTYLEKDQDALTSKYGKHLKYYRFDCHPDSALGPLFKEPYFHIHSTSSDEPRFSINYNNSCPNIILNFIEFIFINHFYVDWYSWVEDICSRNNTEQMLMGLTNLYDSSNHTELLNNELHNLKTLKSKIEEAKNNLYPWSFSPNVNNLSYF